LLHIPRDIFMFGAPMNMDAGICEKNLKAIAKNPSRKARKDDSKFEESTAMRLSEQTSVDRACYPLNGKMGPKRRSDGKSDRTIDKKKSADNYRNPSPVLDLEIWSASPNESPMGYHMRGKLLKEDSVFSLVNSAVDYLLFHWEDIRKEMIASVPSTDPAVHGAVSHLFWYSLYKTADSGETFRAHPNFGGRGFWTWLSLPADSTTDQAEGKTLYLVAGFFKMKGFDQKYVLLARCKSGSTRTQKSPESCLVDRHTFEYVSATKGGHGTTVYIPKFIHIPVQKIDSCKREVVVTETDPENLLSHSYDKRSVLKRNRDVSILKRMRTEWSLKFI